MKRSEKLFAPITLAILLVQCSGDDPTTAVKGTGAVAVQRSLQGQADPLAHYAWHLLNTGQTNFAANAAKPGMDLGLTNTVSSGIVGNGIHVLVSDDGLESDHEDLKANFEGSANKDYTLAYPYSSTKADPKTAKDNHGTCVSGIIAASALNGVGSLGVAPGARLHIANFLSENSAQYEVQKLDQMAPGFDVYNQSWGYSQSDLFAETDDYLTQLESTITSGRGGKGSILNKSAGNSYSIRFSSTVRRIGNSQFDGSNTHPFQIVVAALNAKGTASSYSSPGANIWISAFGGEFGDSDPAILTTDRSGCSYGYAISGATDNTFETGANGNTECNYSSAFNGTSAAAPMSTGVVALLLEANPDLTWRQVKHILAQTAIRTPDTATTYNNPYVSSPANHVWEQGWTKNAAGFSFHNRYGFGRVRTDEAVKIAKNAAPALGTFLNTRKEDGTWKYVRGPFTKSIPDNTANGTTDKVSVTENWVVEAVQIRVAAQHLNIGQLGIELTSPSGTKNIVIPVNNSLEGLADYDKETFLSNAFYGENTNGEWTLKIVDGATGTTGTFTGWEILFFGHAL